MKVEIRKKCFSKYSLLLLAIIVFASCQKKDIGRFDTVTDYIYFDIPYQLNKYGEQTDYRLDSLFYSFALDNIDVKDTVINVVVKIVGVPVDEDRAYTVELVQDETTATNEDWDAGILNNRFIPAGAITDTIHIRVRRNEILQDEWHQITLKIFSGRICRFAVCESDFFRYLGGTGLVVYLFQGFWAFLSGSLSGMD